jgi:DNA polymerase-3 subunit delta'/DNA polymerase-3 subunit gamma/tau
MFEEWLEKIIINMNSYKGCSLCMVSFDGTLNKHVAVEISKRTEGLSPYEVMTIKPDKGNIKIDSVREIKEFSLCRPVYSDKKVVIINDIETMTVEAINAFLKILEEPPDFMIIIAFTTRWNSLLSTVKSRFLKINIPFPMEMRKELSERFKENLNLIAPVINSDYEIIRYLLESDKESIVETAKNYFDTTDIDFLIDSLSVGLSTVPERLGFIFSYFRFLTVISAMNEKNFFNTVASVGRVKESVDPLEFLKYLSKNGISFLHDAFVCKLGTRWKYMDNSGAAIFFGTQNLNFNSNIIYDTIRHFEVLSAATVSKFNFELEVFSHFFRIAECFFLLK